MKFSSRKDLLFTLAIFGTNIFILAVTGYGISKGNITTHGYWVVPLVLVVVIALFWMFFGTKYELSSERLFYQCGPIKGTIALERIREIVKGRTLWVGFRPATSRKGLIIKFDKFNEIYISPQTNEAFITKILELKPDIIISE
jgi:hypothetical protein